MSQEAQIVYDLMLEKFRQTGERFVAITVPHALRNKRRDITSELKANGLIYKEQIYGQQGISCTLIDESLSIDRVKY